MRTEGKPIYEKRANARRARADSLMEVQNLDWAENSKFPEDWDSTILGFITALDDGDFMQSTSKHVLREAQVITTVNRMLA